MNAQKKLKDTVYFVECPVCRQTRELAYKHAKNLEDMRCKKCKKCAKRFV